MTLRKIQVLIRKAIVTSVGASTSIAIKNSIVDHVNNAASICTSSPNREQEYRVIRRLNSI